QPLRGEITFEHVTFAYPGAESPALTDLSFTVAAGETLAVVGRNGAGKTTLFKLICRLYDPIEGRILIDGIDIREFEPAEIRRQIEPCSRTTSTTRPPRRRTSASATCPRSRTATRS